MNPLADQQRIAALRESSPQPTPFDEGAYRYKPGTMRLRDTQRRALAAIERNGGLLGSIGVGHGKTLIAALAPLALERWCGRPVRSLLIVPASMVQPTGRERLLYHDDGFSVRLLDVWSYARLSQRDALDDLFELNPDLVILDEAHKVRDFSAARTRRLDRYVRETLPAVVAMSGTLTTRQLRDYAHLSEWALGERSPLPISRSGIAHCDAVVSSATVGEGAATAGNWYWFRKAYGQGEPRKAVQRAMGANPGVVLTSDPGCSASLVIETVPAWQYGSRELDELERLWSLPDGTMLDSPMHVARHRAHLELGFWYRWQWERWPYDDVEAYLEARSAWSTAVRKFCERHPSEDTPAKLRAALQPQHKLWGAWTRWAEYDERPLPPVATEWVHTDALDWIEEQRSDFESIWVQSDALQKRVDDTFSVRVHGTGHNLQHLQSALIVEPPSNGAAWEQLLGRLHRSGQQADTVRFGVPGTPTALERVRKAAADAKYIEETTGARQRLGFAVRT